MEIDRWTHKGSSTLYRRLEKFAVDCRKLLRQVKNKKIFGAPDLW